ESMLERVRGGQLSAGVFERQRDIHDDDRIVFDDQDRPPLKGRMVHVGSLLARLSATAGGRSAQYDGGRECPERRSILKRRNKRNDRLRRPRPRSWCEPGAARTPIYVGEKSDALTWVSGSAFY